MGDVKTKITQKNILTRLFSKKKDGFFDINEDEEEYDEEEDVQEEIKEEAEDEDAPDATKDGANS